MTAQHKTFTLKWSPLRGYQELPQLKGIRGVYVWGFHIDSKFTPYYVGKADDTQKRIFEHLSHLLGGSYTIFHENSLKAFYRFKQDVPNENAGYGKLYDPAINTLRFFIENEFLRKQAIRTVEYFRLTVAETPIEIDNGFVESAVINVFHLDRLINTKCNATPLVVWSSANFEEANGVECSWVLEYA